MPEDYQDLVLATYREKCEERKLHLNLLKPTTVKLKRECLKKYDGSDEAKDVFSDFFDKDKMDNISLILSQADPGDFRALLNHINGITTKTDEKNSELLAWLIDFRPRPSTTYYKSFDTSAVRSDELQTETTGGDDREGDSLGEDESNVDGELEKQDGLVGDAKESTVGTADIVIIEQLIDEEHDGEEEIITGDPFETDYIPRFSPRQIIIACTLLLSICSISYMIWERMPTKVRTPSLGENSMYWDGDHYEPVKNGAQKPGVAIIPLDLTLLQQQRKITLPDTMTKYSLGKVWYKGYKDNHEYFTTAGVYPPDTLRTLKKFSPGILKDHISYYRYLFTRLLWFLCAAFLISLGGYLVSRLKKEVKQPVKERETDDAESLAGVELA
jgi:hypothetical protein